MCVTHTPHPPVASSRQRQLTGNTKGEQGGAGGASGREY